ncbi:MAG: MBL fold metallo-hydrolase [Planctomycetota bacterium]|jgi:glyoxylase-like metal-dependent hydrolase (beta-lactamase superfamily II)
MQPLPRRPLLTSLHGAVLGLVLVPCAFAGGDAWTDLGQALPGAGGAPLLDGSGSLAGGTLATLTLTGAASSAPATLVIGLSELSVPFKGGTMVPQTDVLLPFTTDGAGELTLSANWPAALPPGTQVWFQWWITDGGAPVGLAASNALLGTVPEPPVPGSFPADWVHGDCPEPGIQVHAYDANTYILRQSMCTNFEGPFIYLLFGEDKVLQLDTGAGGVPIGNTVYGLIDDWLLAQGKASIELVVAHTHSHGDHTAGDGQFSGQPDTTLVGTSTNAVKAFWGWSDWPNDVVSYDLGGRVVDVLAIPGHQEASIAVYDRETALLLTGDTLYPGFLFIFGAISGGNFAKYQASIQRLVDFVADKPVAWVLGTHIEMTATPFVAYPYGTSFQPLERVLQLNRHHLKELNTAVQAMGGSPVQQAHADFIIQPSG